MLKFHSHYFDIFIPGKENAEEHNNNCPKGFLCGRRLNIVVWNTVSVRTDFGPLLSLSTRPRDTLFGRHSQGIRDELKFRDRSLFQFTLIECTTWCVKNTLFWTKSPRTVNDRSFENDRFLDLFCRYVFTFLWAFLSVVHTKSPEGHPCPAGVI